MRSIKIKHQKLANEAGNIFIAKGLPAKEKISLCWQNDESLLISEKYPEVFLREESYQDITIKY